MANLLDSACTCPEFWRGQRERPRCVSHEPAPADLPPGKARRKSDGSVVDVLASAGLPAAPDGDHGVSWQPFP